MGIGNFFKSLGRGMGKAFNFAKDAGLTDEVVGLALDWARKSQDKFIDNNDRREFVVKMLVAKGVPESVSRLATELGVRLLKDELKKVGV